VLLLGEARLGRIAFDEFATRTTLRQQRAGASGLRPDAIYYATEAQGRSERESTRELDPSVAWATLPFLSVQLETVPTTSVRDACPTRLERRE
jgi:hypothetical protein